MSNTNTLDDINLCRAFIAKRPSLDARDYIRDWRDAEGRAIYCRESRRITQQLNDARAMLDYCASNGVDLTAALRVSGARLCINANGALEYHVGQYWPTEYRAAVARAVSSAIWTYWRDQCGIDTADKLREKARKEFGRGIAARWFR